MKQTSMTIPIANIREIRVVGDDDYNVLLQDSMDQIGQHVPIKVIQYERKGFFWFLKPRIYILLDGQRR